MFVIISYWLFNFNFNQSQSGSIKSDASFFEESDTYWKPATDCSEIYQQMARNKYREIPRHLIQ